MRKIILFSFIILSFATTYPAQAGDFELMGGDEIIQLSYLTTSTLLGTQEQGLNFGLLLTEKRDIIGTMGLTVPGLIGDPLPDWLSFAFGAKGYFALLSDPVDLEVFSLAPGVESRLTLPTKMPMHLTGSFYYAPKIITFGDAENMYDITARYEVEFTSSTTGFVGYRLLRYEQEEGGGEEIDVDEGIHAGVRITF
jgi:hypothetical protein